MNETTTFTPAPAGWRHVFINLDTAEVYTRALMGWYVTQSEDGPEILPVGSDSDERAAHCRVIGPGDPTPDLDDLLDTPWWAGRWVHEMLVEDGYIPVYRIDGKWFRWETVENGHSEHCYPIRTRTELAEACEATMRREFKVHPQLEGVICGTAARIFAAKARTEPSYFDFTPLPDFTVMHVAEEGGAA